MKIMKYLFKKKKKNDEIAFIDVGMVSNFFLFNQNIIIQIVSDLAV